MGTSKALLALLSKALIIFIFCSISQILDCIVDAHIFPPDVALVDLDVGYGTSGEPGDRLVVNATLTVLLSLLSTVQHLLSAESIKISVLLDSFLLQEFVNVHWSQLLQSLRTCATDNTATWGGGGGGVVLLPFAQQAKGVLLVAQFSPIYELLLGIS